MKSTSIIYKNADVDPYCLFCSEDSNGCHLEVYPRPNAEVYICGCGGSRYVDAEELRTLDPKDVVADPQRVAAAHKSFQSPKGILGLSEKMDLTLILRQ